MKKIYTSYGSDFQCLKKTFRIMRISLFLLLASIFHTFANDSYSQKIRLSIDFSNEKLVDAMDEIEKLTEFYFLYNEKLVDTDRKITLSAKNQKIDIVLNELFSGTDVDFTITDRKIILAPSFLSNKQQPSITGKITDESGVPLIGVTVVVKGTNQGTTTDINGMYSINNIPKDAILVFSFIGMETKEVQVGNSTNINVTLAKSLMQLEQLVVTGYGTKLKTDVVSSISSINPNDLTKVPTTDIGEMLRGKAAGVQVTLSSAAPGSSSNILIRGQRSVGGGNKPLIIVDGVPVGDINSVNPSDVASVDILKDAAAQAIYGARAASGVILITTKTGSIGKAKLTYNGFYGIQQIKPNFDVFTPEEYIQLKREANRTVNNDEYQPDNLVFSPIELEVMESEEYINWREEVLRLAPMQNHTLSLSSGTEKTKIYTSVNFQNQDGVIPNTDFKKGSFRFNLDQNITNWLTVGINSSAQIAQRNNPTVGNILARLVYNSPLGKIYNDDGSYRLYPNGFQDLTNPLIDIHETSQITNNRNDLFRIFFDISPIKGFNYRINASRRSYNQKVDTYATALSATGVSNGNKGQGNLRFRTMSEWQLENIIDYNLKSGQNSIDFTFVQSTINNNFSSFNLDVNNTANDILNIYGLGTAESYIPSLSANKRNLLSFVGRVEYNYSRKYYITASVRSDGSSVFGADNKWSVFPAVSLGWNIHKEQFLPDNSIISNLKLRASYGSVGNEAIDPYKSLSNAEQKDYIFGDKVITGYNPGNTLPNPKLRWETSTTLNAGVDFGLLKNRISGSLEFYDTKTRDLLILRSLNAGLGYDHFWDNIGEIQNTGIEFQLSSAVVSRNDLNININLVFSRNRNEIIDLYGNGEDDIANKWFIGSPINVYYTQLYDGIWQIDDDIANSHMPDAKPGEIKVKDKNEDGKLDEDDQYIISGDPSWLGTFSLNMNYKGIDFAMDIMTVQGITRENRYLNRYAYGGTLRGDRNQIAVDYWLPENPGGTYARPREGNDPAYVQTMGFQDASYIRLQNLTLGYTLPASIVSKLKMNKIRLYCTAHNLITKTEFLSYSPEKDPGSYPEAVVIVGGVQINF